MGYASEQHRDQTCKLWQYLTTSAPAGDNSDQDHVAVSSLKKVILAIEGLCFDEIHPGNTLDFKLSHQDVAHIFVKFKPLFINRVHSQKKTAVEADPSTAPSFHPQLCQSSEKLQKHWRNSNNAH
jgi:hypothetical protein